MKTAVVFLTNYPKIETLAFAQELSLKTDTFVVVDSMQKLPDATAKELAHPGNVNIIQIEDSICRLTGYTNSNISDNSTHIKKNPIAMDKFLYWFCEKNTEYDFLWVLEDDVFVPSVQTLENLTIGYSAYDLVVQDNKLKTDDLKVWHWRSIMDKISEPYYNSMICAMGISRKLLNCIKEYVDKNKTLIYSEVMFNTIAMHNDLNVICPFELKSIVWMGEWTDEVIYQLPNNLFHPMKEIDKHPGIREKIVKWEAKNRKPRRQIPRFLKKMM
jgi:hypothetical protein